MKLNKYKKYFLFVLLFCVIIFLTFYTIFSKNSPKDIIENIKDIKAKYIIICLGLISLYFLLQGIYMKRNLKIMDKKINIFQGIFYSLVEFFFSGITPSSTGGQPVQLYYMSKDKIPKKKSLITLLINTIYFKLIIVIFGLFVLIFDHNLIFDISIIFTIFFFVGIIADLFIVVGGYLLLYNQSLLNKILEILEKMIRLVKKNYDMKINDNIELYNKEIKNISNHKLELFNEFLITLVQRICLFSISYVVYRAFNLNEYNFIQIVIIQISVQTTIEFIPLPGGTGISEYLFSVFYLTIYSTSLVASAMLVTRIFSFYIPLMLSGIILLIKFLRDTFIEN